jgi:hypothetical protein
LRRGQSMIIQLEGGINMQWDPTIWTKRKDVFTKDVDAMVEF